MALSGLSTFFQYISSRSYNIITHSVDICCIIGWGSFVNPGKKFLPNSGVAGTAIATVLGALVMIIIAFSYAYMVPKYPKAGGEFTFTKECYGKIPAYICGWFLVAAYLTNVPMNSTAIPLKSRHCPDDTRRASGDLRRNALRCGACERQGERRKFFTDMGI